MASLFSLEPVSFMSLVKPVGHNAGKVALDEGDQRKLNFDCAMIVGRG